MLKAYHAIRPLSDEDRQLIPWCDRSGIALGAINWLAWVALEGRRFEDADGVLGRFDEFARRLEAGW